MTYINSLFRKFIKQVLKYKYFFGVKIYNFYNYDAITTSILIYFT